MVAAVSGVEVKILFEEEANGLGVKLGDLAYPIVEHRLGA
jgi:hypothetical protein